ncbi:MAG TPA: hypothetical protein V6D11_02360 [Waterburya sp.]|jgi:hypothetical protein
MKAVAELSAIAVQAASYVQQAPALGLGRVPRAQRKEGLGFVAELIWGKGN